MSTAQRAILHVDMDAFFASVEQLDHPELRGLPVLVGGDGLRGVVAAASYEARRFGCHSAQPMAHAKACCPKAVVMPPRGRRYREISKRVFAIMADFTPVVEPLSIDEAFLDVTGTERLHGPPPRIARELRRRIAEAVSLTASVGVAPNKFLAKLASDQNKPDGCTVVDQRWIEEVLPGLPIERMWGVGPATAARLHRRGLQTFGDLAAAPESILEAAVGRDGQRLRRLAQGIDVRSVVVSRSSRSVSHERTFGVDVADAEAVRRALLEETEQVARRLRHHACSARTVTVKIRFGAFQTITRSRTLPVATDRTDHLWTAAAELFDQWVRGSFQPVRLIGMAASQIIPAGQSSGQLCLFDVEADEQAEGRRRLDQVTDVISKKFGAGSIRRGG